MSPAVSRALRLLAFVVVLPAMCFAGVLFYGKALTDAQVAEGSLPTQEQARARVAEMARRFVALTPAQHLVIAQTELARDYNADAGTGGNFELAAQHLRAIPETATEHAVVGPLMVEIDRRRVATRAAEARHREVLFIEASQRVAARVRETGGDLEDRREALARSLDQLSPQGLGCVHAEGDDATLLTFSLCECDVAMLDKVARPEHRAGLRAMGFRAVRCGHDGGPSVDLSASR
jgi:hypothetical protein